MTTSHQSIQDTYGLPRDAVETARLNEQHYWITHVFTFLIHPLIPTDTPNLRVADVACGSGAWLIDVAAQYLSARCDGFDISGEQFPPQKDLAPKFGERVRFHVHSAADPAGVPEAFKGQFDIVAVRLLHISLIGAQWEQAVRNVVSMLKPGGFIQWIDWDPNTIRIIQLTPLAPKSGLEQLLSGFRMFLRTRDAGATDRLPAMLAANGIEDLVSELYPNDRDAESRDFFSRTLVESVPHVIRKMIAKGEGGEWDEGRIEEGSRLAERDFAEKKAFVRFENWCHVGRKGGVA